MNRMAVGLAVGAGYVLGRTKKAKFALAVGTVVAGKRLNLSPKALGALVTQQLENNPQFKEIGDQLRQDLRGVGRAATGSLLNRRLDDLADRLHDRTLGIQDRIDGVVPDEAEEETPSKDTPKETPSKKAPAKKTQARKPPAKKTAKAAKKTAQKAPRKAARKKTTAAARTGGRSTGGGNDHG